MPTFSRPSRILAILLVAWLSLTTARAQETAPSEPLPQDPNNLYGKFDNGLSYIIRKAPNPPGKVSLDLHVRTGALNENDDQRGLAHFLEHMAFKGSAHYGPDQLIKYLSSLGLTFGADTNAHTSFNETVYKLTMPDAKPETIDSALTVLSDYASGLTLGIDQVNAERGVILEEARTRKGAGERIGKELRKKLFAGTRLESHDVIGEEEQIKTFPQSTFQDYWNTWYRPENMTLIVAGDIDPAAVVAQAKARLGTFTARADARPAQKAGLKPFESRKAFILSDPEQVSGEVVLECLKPSLGPVTTYSQYRREVLAGVGEWIVNRRLSDRIARGGAPFRKASVDTGDFLLEALDVSANAEGEPKDWNAMLDGLVEEISRAVDYGFTQQEMDLATRNLISSGEWAVKTEATIDSKDWVSLTASKVGRQRPILSAQQQLDLAKRITTGLDKEEVHKIFQDNFSGAPYAYIVILPQKEGVTLPTQSDVLAAASAAWAKKTQPLAENAAAQSLLAAEPAPGKVVSTEVDDQLGVGSMVFENGVVLHHKFLDAKKDQVSIRIVLPGGVLQETEATKGLSSLASQIVDQPATHRLSSPQVRDLMTGRNVGVQGGIGLDALSFSVSGSPADLPVGLQLVHALLTDATLEQSAVDDWKKAQLDEIKQRETSAQAQLAEAVSQTLGAGDPRLAPLKTQDIERATREDAERWFARIAQDAAIEVTIVGDISRESATELVAKYLGSLPKRKGTFNDLDTLRKLDRPAGPYVTTITFHGITPTAIVMAGFVGCEETNPDRRPLSLASMVLSERMIERIRMKDNLVYSIQCMSRPSSGLPGMGMFFAAAPTDPKNADRLSATINELIKAMADTGPTDKELETAKKQVMNTLSVQMKEPDFWVAQLSMLVYHQRKLEELRQIPGVFDTFTADQVRDTLRKYAIPEREFRLATVPDKVPATRPASQPAPAEPVGAR